MGSIFLFKFQFKNIGCLIKVKLFKVNDVVVIFFSNEQILRERSQKKNNLFMSASVRALIIQSLRVTPTIAKNQITLR